MRMDEFMNVLQTKVATQQPHYPDNAESILEVLFDAYNESSVNSGRTATLARRFSHGVTGF